MLAVVGGTLLPSVLDGLVALFGSDGRVACSGVLVADGLVLSAGHCADAEAVGLGPSGDEHPAEVAEVVLHPDPAVDLSLLRLATPVPGRVWPLSDAVPPVGEGASIAGYGATADGADDAGTKRGADTEVVASTSASLLLFSPEANACSGDSGGPVTTADDGAVHLVALVTEVDPACVGGRTVGVPLGLGRAWLSEVAPEVAWGAWSPPDEAPVSPRGCASAPGGAPVALPGLLLVRWFCRTGRRASAETGG
jgi:hypothetical protein